MAEAKKTETPKKVNPDTSTPTQATNTIAVISLVLGIVSFMGGLFFGGLLFGIPAIVLGIIGMKKPGGKGLGIAGVILGTLGSLATILVITFWVVGVGFLGQAANEIEKSATTYQSEQQEIISAQREFASGETATFGKLEVKASVVESDYTPANKYSRAREGKKFIVVQVDVKNIDDHTTSVSGYSFKVEDENGVLSSSNFTKAPGKAFQTVSLAEGGSTGGQIVFEVDEDAAELKLTKEEYAYNYDTRRSETVKFSLAL
jgi:hypothetical protein